MTRPTRVLVALLACAAAACADEGPVSGPGTLTATLMGPNGAEGAALIVILDEAIETIDPLGETEVYARVGSSNTQVVLINQAGGTLSFRLAVADTTRPPAIVIEEVAGPDDALRSNLAAYSVAFAR